MTIDLQTLFIYRQYVDFPIYHYFDRKTYSIVSVENPNDKPKSDTENYERYLPMFQIDKEKIVNDYLSVLNNPKLERDFKNSNIDIGEFLIRNYSVSEADSWRSFYKNEVYKAAVAWCEKNHIRYKE